MTALENIDIEVANFFASSTARNSEKKEYLPVLNIIAAQLILDMSQVMGDILIAARPDYEFEWVLWRTGHKSALEYNSVGVRPSNILSREPFFPLIHVKSLAGLLARNKVKPSDNVFIKRLKSVSSTYASVSTNL